MQNILDKIKSFLKVGEKDTKSGEDVLIVEDVIDIEISGDDLCACGGMCGCCNGVEAVAGEESKGCCSDATDSEEASGCCGSDSCCSKK